MRRSYGSSFVFVSLQQKWSQKSWPLRNNQPYNHVIKVLFSLTMSTYLLEENSSENRLKCEGLMDENP